LHATEVLHPIDTRDTRESAQLPAVADWRVHDRQSSRNPDWAATMYFSTIRKVINSPRGINRLRELLDRGFLNSLTGGRAAPPGRTFQALSNIRGESFKSCKVLNSPLRSACVSLPIVMPKALRWIDVQEQQNSANGGR